MCQRGLVDSAAAGKAVQWKQSCISTPDSSLLISSQLLTTYGLHLMADLSDIKGQLAVLPLDFLSILIILCNLNAVLRPSDLSLWSDISNL